MKAILYVFIIGLCFTCIAEEASEIEKINQQLKATRKALGQANNNRLFTRICGLIST